MDSRKRQSSDGDDKANPPLPSWVYKQPIAYTSHPSPVALFTVLILEDIKLPASLTTSLSAIMLIALLVTARTHNRQHALRHRVRQLPHWPCCLYACKSGTIHTCAHF